MYKEKISKIAKNIYCWIKSWYSVFSARAIDCVIVISALGIVLFSGVEEYKTRASAREIKIEKVTRSWIITYRTDEGNKRGKPQKTVISAESSSKAKEEFRISNPKAVIISVSEKK